MLEECDRDTYLLIKNDVLNKNLNDAIWALINKGRFSEANYLFLCSVPDNIRVKYAIWLSNQGIKNIKDPILKYLCYYTIEVMERFGTKKFDPQDASSMFFEIEQNIDDLNSIESKSAWVLHWACRVASDFKNRNVVICGSHTYHCALNVYIENKENEIKNTIIKRKINKIKDIILFKNILHHMHTYFFTTKALKFGLNLLINKEKKFK